MVDWDDYDGDGDSDFAVYDPSSGEWDIRGVTTGLVWGGDPGDIPAPGDYDGDGTADLGYFDRFSGEWNIARISGEVITAGVIWGAWGDVPVPGDYEGDGTTDLATWRNADGKWRIRGVTSVWYGRRETMIPVPGDYDGDGTCDIAILDIDPAKRTWYVRGVRNRAFWIDGSTAFPMDYNGDGTTELGFYRSSTGWWRMRQLSGPAVYSRIWGVPQWNGIPFILDFNGDGAADLGSFRPHKGAAGRWLIRETNAPTGTWETVDWSALSTDSIVVGATSY